MYYQECIMRGKGVLNIVCLVCQMYVCWKYCDLWQSWRDYWRCDKVSVPCKTLHLLLRLAKVSFVRGGNGVSVLPPPPPNPPTGSGIRRMQVVVRPLSLRILDTLRCTQYSRGGSKDTPSKYNTGTAKYIAPFESCWDGLLYCNNACHLCYTSTIFLIVLNEYSW